MNKRRLAKSVVISVCVEVINKLSPILVLSLAQLRLGREGFGYAQFSMNLVESCMPFIVFGYTMIVSQDLEILKSKPQKIGSLISSFFLLRFLHACVTTLVLFGLCLYVDNYENYFPLVFVLSLLLFLSAFELTPVLMATQQFHLLNLVLGVSKICTLIAIYIFVQDTDDANLYAILTLGTNAIVCIFTTFYGLRGITLKRPDLKIMKSLFLRGSHFALIYIAMMLIERYDIFLAEHTGGAIGAALYSGPARIAQSLHGVIAAIGVIFVSELLSVKEDENFKNHIRLSLLGASLLMFPLCIGVWWVDQSLITFIFDDSFLPSARILSLLVVAAAAQSLTSIWGFQVLALKKRINAFSLSIFCGLMGGLGFSLYFMGQQTLLLIAAGSVLAKTICVSLVYLSARSFLGDRMLLIMTRPFLASLLMGVFLFYTQPNIGGAPLVKTLFAAGTIYFLVIITFYFREIKKLALQHLVLKR